jgi:S1-C subfamily serine protease
LRGIRIGPRNTIIPGDVILEVDGKQVTSAALLNARLDDYQVGDTITLTIWRDGKREQVRATLQRGEGEASR